MSLKKSCWHTADFFAKKMSNWCRSRNGICGTSGIEKQAFGVSELPWLPMRGNVTGKDSSHVRDLH